MSTETVLNNIRARCGEYLIVLNTINADFPPQMTIVPFGNLIGACENCGHRLEEADVQDLPEEDQRKIVDDLMVLCHPRMRRVLKAMLFHEGTCAVKVARLKAMAARWN